MADDRTLRMGLDIGSATVKIVLLAGVDVVFEEYRRHNADVRGELALLLDLAAGRFPDASVLASVTGTGGLGVAERLGLPFIQEVIAGTEAVHRFHPQADVVIELGGEDAKITYLRPTPEQRMNGTCAGGTGAFIDQMATLLGTDPAGLDTLAANHQHVYPIASRCGVFAKTDLQPLLNEGAATTDLAASIFNAVAIQTVAGLACGRPVRGQVVFLGGPLHFLPQLRQAYQRVLADARCSFDTPPRAQLYVAIGAALLATGPAVALSAITKRFHAGTAPARTSSRVRPLFVDTDEREAFVDRHSRVTIPSLPIERANGPCFLGIDAGSTTLKAVIINDQCEILFSHYASNGSDPVGCAVDIARRVHRELPATARVVRSCVTGYGEGLVKTALGLDDGEVETMAHYRAARHVCPEVTALIDIGGQDMKYLRTHAGSIDSIAVNEACSSGCGSFLQAFAEAMGLEVEAFCQAALAALAPVDLGSRCTVFMNSSVKQAQKEGASVGDIAAGLSYSVVRNALYKVIKLRDPNDLGDHVVVQGGTFLNDAVLRAFELLTGRQVIRPDLAGLMGAFGAALTAQGRYRALAGERVGGAVTSRLLGPDALEGLRVATELSACRLCHNQCQRTISTFSTGERHVSGNRCDRGAGGERRADPPPNVFDAKYRRLFQYRRLRHSEAPRGEIGIPRALNLYENYPLWFTTLSALGFRVVLSGRSSTRLFERGMDTIASENICYPAKLAHGHIVDLLDRGLTTIFYPCVSYEQLTVQGADDRYNCSIVAEYPQLIANNIDRVRDEGVRFLQPFLNLSNIDHLTRRLTEEFSGFGVTSVEMGRALAEGFAADAAFRADVAAMGREALAYLSRTGGRGIVLAGRPYHLDPQVHHGIPEMINSLGMAVLTEDCVIEPGVLERPIRVRDQWAYHSRLYQAAAAVTTRDDLELVQLNSFGCGLDAIAIEQAQEILEARDNVYTSLKIDEISNLGAARIRVRSLAAAAGERAGAERTRELTSYTLDRPAFTPEHRARHTLLAPQMSPIHFALLECALRRCGYRVVILESASQADIDTGLRYVNNDACYPAIIVAGQLIDAFASGRFDPDECSVIMPQTGGMCRATNYVALMRKALRDAGYGQVVILGVSAVGVENHPGFALDATLIRRTLQSIILGDLLQTLLLRVRPYEVTPGAANGLCLRMSQITREYLLHDGRSPSYGRKLNYLRLVKHIVTQFDRLPLRGGPRLPRVGIVGEIFVKFHPDANNHVVAVVESEGCEAVLPGLTEFFLSFLHNGEWNRRHLGTELSDRGVKRLLYHAMELYRTPIRRALRRTRGKFTAPGRFAALADETATVLSLGAQAGEGWLLTGEMLDLIHSGVPNIICVQPFACLPNHITGKGMFRELRRRYPQANIVGIDYDPGASEVNQLNRIKLMISAARLRHTGD
jgi:predicted CoA-substrate-specific enzyme activase